MITWRLIARYLRRHPGRSTLTLLSIAIGIASVIAVSLATATTRQAYRRMYEEIAGRAALQVTAPANAMFPQEVADDIARVPGRPSGRAQLSAGDADRLRAQVADPDRDRHRSGPRLRRAGIRIARRPLPDA